MQSKSHHRSSLQTVSKTERIQTVQKWRGNLKHKGGSEQKDCRGTNGLQVHAIIPTVLIVSPPLFTPHHGLNQPPFTPNHVISHLTAQSLWVGVFYNDLTISAWQNRKKTSPPSLCGRPRIACARVSLFSFWADVPLKTKRLMMTSTT